MDSDTESEVELDRNKSSPVYEKNVSPDQMNKSEPLKSSLIVYGEPENTNAIVVDLGSETVRIGDAYANFRSPQYDVSSIVGFIPPVESDTTDDVKPSKLKYLFGKSLRTNVPNNMEVKPMIFDGLIDDFDMFSDFFQLYIEEKLKVDPKEHLFMFSEANHTSNEDRQKLAALLFEKFGIKGFYVKPSAVFQLLFRSRTDVGTVVDLGACHASVTPVVNNYILKNSYWKADLGGNYLIDQGIRLFELSKFELIPSPYVKHRTTVFGTPLTEEESDDEEDINIFGSTNSCPTRVCPPSPKFVMNESVVLSRSFHIWSQHEIVKNFIHSTCSVWPTSLYQKVDHDFSPDFRKLHAFPDGRVVEFLDEPFALTESLFNQYYSRLPTVPPMPTLPKMITKMLADSDAELQDKLMANVHLTGGTSRLHGLRTRLQYECNLNIANTTILSSSNNPQFDAYCGAAAMATQPFMAAEWYSKAEYDEGSTRLHEW